MADNPSTTIPPFTDTQVLPTCAVSCGPLYDANGGCVPPKAPSTWKATDYTSCFCSHSKVAPFSTAATGVCDQACPASGLTSIQKWFTSICNVQQNQANNQATSSSASATATSKASSGGGGSDWISTHWQWVIMLVILVVGITGIWIGACIWRRRYLRKRDRQFALGQKSSGSASHPSWGPGVGSGSEAPDPSPAGYDSQRNSGAILTSASGAPPASAPLQEKVAKAKRWIVKERT